MLWKKEASSHHSSHFFRPSTSFSSTSAPCRRMSDAHAPVSGGPVSRGSVPTLDSRLPMMMRMISSLFLFLVLAGLSWLTLVSMRSTSGTTAAQKTGKNVNETAASKQMSLCFSLNLIERKLRTLNLTHVGRYVPANKSMDGPPRYDHLSCFVMKARYNCATTATTGDRATDWRLVLNTTKDGEDCSPRALVERFGGPVALAEDLQSRVTQEKSKPYVVVFHGNSFLRQMWEALTCIWRHQITNLLLQQGGPDISLAGLRDRGPIDTHEIGTILRNPSDEMGCHGSTNLRGYYESDITVPSTIRDCNDNIAMVEFGNKIQFYYIFRPWVYANVTGVYDKVGLMANDIDVLVFNDGENKKYPQSIREQLGAGVFDESIVWDLDEFKRIQVRDTKRWFGATNPWVTMPPDNHPCMPGVPDDEADLLLFLLLQRKYHASHEPQSL